MKSLFAIVAVVLAVSMAAPAMAQDVSGCSQNGGDYFLVCDTASGNVNGANRLGARSETGTQGAVEYNLFFV